MVQRLADEGPKRNDEVMRVHRATRDEVSRRLLRQPHLLLRSEQDDVGKRRLHVIANAASALGTGDDALERFRAVRLARCRPLAQVAQMRRIDGEVPGEGAAQRLVGGDEGAQPLVDLPVRPLPALLDREHHDEADADADQREEGKPDHRHEDAVPGTEIEIAQHVVPLF